MHTYTCTNIHTYRHVHVRTYIHVHVCMHTYTCTYIHTYIHVHVRKYIHRCILMYTYWYVVAIKEIVSVPVLTYTKADQNYYSRNSSGYICSQQRGNIMNVCSHNSFIVCGFVCSTYLGRFMELSMWAYMN